MHFPAVRQYSNWLSDCLSVVQVTVAPELVIFIILTLEIVGAGAGVGGGPTFTVTDAVTVPAGELQLTEYALVAGKAGVT